MKKVEAGDGGGDTRNLEVPKRSSVSHASVEIASRIVGGGLVIDVMAVVVAAAVVIVVVVSTPKAAV